MLLCASFAGSAFRRRWAGHRTTQIRLFGSSLYGFEVSSLETTAHVPHAQAALANALDSVADFVARPGIVATLEVILARRTAAVVDA